MTPFDYFIANAIAVFLLSMMGHFLARDNAGWKDYLMMTLASIFYAIIIGWAFMKVLIDIEFACYVTVGIIGSIVLVIFMNCIIYTIDTFNQ